jgi:hypothetical protein
VKATLYSKIVVMRHSRPEPFILACWRFYCSLTRRGANNVSHSRTRTLGKVAARGVGGTVSKWTVLAKVSGGAGYGVHRRLHQGRAARPRTPLKNPRPDAIDCEMIVMSMAAARHAETITGAMSAEQDILRALIRIGER